LKILIQWTRAHPVDWEELDSSKWFAAPKKPIPVGMELIDDDAGWPYQICVQGITFTADHYAVSDLPGRAINVAHWNEDDEDYPDGEKFASIWTFYPLVGDAELGYRIKMSQVMYAQSEVAKRIPADRENCVMKEWEEFPRPDFEITKNGIWVSDELNEAHDKARSNPNWRDWM